MNREFIEKEQNIALKCRKSLVVTGIKSVDSFDENNIQITTEDGFVLFIEGSEIVIKDVNLDKSCVEAVGNFTAFYYDAERVKRKKFSFSWIFGAK